MSHHNSGKDRSAGQSVFSWSRMIRWSGRTLSCSSGVPGMPSWQPDQLQKPCRSWGRARHSICSSPMSSCPAFAGKASTECFPITGGARRYRSSGAPDLPTDRARSRAIPRTPAGRLMLRTSPRTMPHDFVSGPPLRRCTRQTFQAGCGSGLARPRRFATASRNRSLPRCNSMTER